ncbi:hypothetical protein E2C01_081098 [Portunus trituberculatus]|uniref:Uncharacterized protein n=1 Tax=Portunus trituberculatus TaxID=210409 RepID=A0A5B7IUW9_PORTR|nr:hypothetical protein [Portunus trituberculatus]
MAFDRSKQSDALEPRQRASSCDNPLLVHANMWEFTERQTRRPRHPSRPSRQPRPVNTAAPGEYRTPTLLILVALC